MNRTPADMSPRQGQTTSSQNQSPSADARRRVDPQMPHEQDESSASQASATPRHAEVGRPAYGNATDGTQDTDEGPVTDRVYNDTLADRGATKPRQ